jgi:hypothetical protein
VRSERGPLSEKPAELIEHLIKVPDEPPAGVFQASAYGI